MLWSGDPETLSNLWLGFGLGACAGAVVAIADRFGVGFSASKPDSADRLMGHEHEDRKSVLRDLSTILRGGAFGLWMALCFSVTDDMQYAVAISVSSLALLAALARLGRMDLQGDVIGEEPAGEGRRVVKLDDQTLWAGIGGAALAALTLAMEYWP